MITVQVKHVNVILVSHLFQHDVNTAQHWQPAESTRKYTSSAKNVKCTIIIEMWVIISQPQIFKDKYLHCFCMHTGSMCACELYSEEICKQGWYKKMKMRPMFDIRGNILNEFTASSDLYDIV